MYILLFFTCRCTCRFRHMTNQFPLQFRDASSGALWHDHSPPVHRDTRPLCDEQCLHQASLHCLQREPALPGDSATHADSHLVKMGLAEKPEVTGLCMYIHTLSHVHISYCIADFGLFHYVIPILSFLPAAF